MAVSSRSYPFAWPSAVEQPKELQDLHDEPIVQVTLPSGDTAFLVTRYDDIRAVLADPRVSKNRNRPDVARMTTKKVKVFQRQVDMDPPGHTRMRRLIAKAFTAHRIDKFRPRIEQITDELLDELAGRTSPADLNQSFSYPLTIRIICELLGVPASERANFGDTSSPPWGYMRELIDRKRESPDDNLISALIKVSDEDGGRLSEDELHWWSTLLLLAGYETTASQLSGCAVLLLSRPDQVALLREDYSRVPGAVEELLRCQVVGSSLSMLRYVTEDIEVAGVKIPKGSSIIPVLESANHDQSAFACPGQLDVTRTGRQQLTFSTGQHFCVGAPLARAELQIALSGLLRRFPALRLAVPLGELRRQSDQFFQGFAEVPVAW
jgi:cytochrome P450